MKRILATILLASVLLLAGCGIDEPPITYTKPYRLEGTVGSGAKGGSGMTREFKARNVYYTVYGPFSYGIQMRMVDANGLDLPSPVWGAVDPEYLEIVGYVSPNLAVFLPAKVGTATVSATQDDFTTTANVVILPVHQVAIGESFDFDGDGIPDFIRNDILKMTFPHGAVKLGFVPTPEYLDEVPADIAVPSEALTIEFDNTYYVGGNMIVACNASNGGVYAVLLWTGESNNELSYIKLR